MNSSYGNINGKEPETDRWKDDSFSPEDNVLLEMIGNNLKAELDIEEVKSDPGYEVTSRNVKIILSDYKSNTVKIKNREFITKAIASDGQEEWNIEEEINKIKHEINHSKLDEISSEWVKDWHEKKQSGGKPDAVKEEIREYITSALSHDEEVGEPEPEIIRKKGIVRPLVIRYTSVAAAVITGTIIIFTTLLPGNDPGKIFHRYYEPVQAVSPVTRSVTTNLTDTWTAAVMDYNNGDYEAAKIEFSELSNLDPLSAAPRFYLGVTLLGLEDYSQAASLLSGVTEEQAEFAKEARWYLGMVYLQQGNVKAASECFEILAQSPGYYSERAEKILRRLR